MKNKMVFFASMGTRILNGTWHSKGEKYLTKTSKDQDSSLSLFFFSSLSLDSYCYKLSPSTLK